MDFFKLVDKRFATKAYVDGTEISDEDLKKMMEAANKGPTALGMDDVRTVVFRTKDAREKVATYFAGFNAVKVKTAGALVVFLGQKNELMVKDNGAQMWKNMPYLDQNDENAQKMMKVSLDWLNSAASRSDTYDVISVGTKQAYLALAATELGYGSTTMTGIDFNGLENYLKENQALNDGERVVLAVVIGKIDETSPFNSANGQPKQRMNYNDFVTEIK